MGKVIEGKEQECSRKHEETGVCSGGLASGSEGLEGRIYVATCG